MNFNPEPFKTARDNQLAIEDAEYILSRKGTSYNPNCVIELPSGKEITGIEMNRYCRKS
ncbi:MAG: hypothetical protein ACREQA_19615 [Candidatus Binatia bacterium]